MLAILGAFSRHCETSQRFVDGSNEGHRTIAHQKEAPIGEDDMASLNEKCGHDISMQRRIEGKYSFSKLKIENCPTDCVSFCYFVMFCLKKCCISLQIGYDVIAAIFTI